MSTSVDAVTAAFNGATEKPGSVRYTFERIKGVDVDRITHKLVLPNGKEVDHVNGVDVDGSQYNVYKTGDISLKTRKNPAGWQDTTITRSDNSTFTLFQGQDGVVRVTDSRAAGTDYNAGLFLDELNKTTTAMTGLPANAPKPQAVAAQSSAQTAGHLATTRIHIEGSSTSIQHGGDKVHTYRTPGEDVGPQKPHGRAFKIELIEGQAAAEHSALSRLPDDARRQALDYARAGGKFIIQHHEEPGSTPASGIVAGKKKAAASQNLSQ